MQLIWNTTISQQGKLKLQTHVVVIKVNNKLFFDAKLAVNSWEIYNRPHKLTLFQRVNISAQV